MLRGMDIKHKRPSPCVPLDGPRRGRSANSAIKRYIMTQENRPIESCDRQKEACIMENRTEMIMYQTEDGQTRIDVRMENETVWLSINQMVELFNSSKSNLSEHVKHIFAEGELDKQAVVRKIRTTAADGKTYNVDYYNLDVIISVVYRVKSLRGTWAHGCRDYHASGRQQQTFYGYDSFAGGQAS